MADNDLPAEVNRLIDMFVASMDHVELLVRLHAAPSDTFTVDDLASASHIDRATVVRICRDFQSADVVRESGDAYRYAPSSREHDAIAELVKMYDTRPVSLVRAVYARPTPIKSFADAFRLRRSD